MIDLHVEGYCQECAGFHIYEFAHEKVGKEIGKDD